MAALLYTLLLVVVAVSTLQAPVFAVTYAFHPSWTPTKVTRVLRAATSGWALGVVGVGKQRALRASVTLRYLERSTATRRNGSFSCDDGREFLASQ